MNETLAQKIINSFDPRAALTGGRALTLAEAKDIVVRAARGDRMAGFWADQVKSGTISIGMDERTGAVYFGMPTAPIPAGMPTTDPQLTKDASVDELRVERSQLRLEVTRLEAELVEIAEELHLEREDLGGGLCTWWLPAEPGPVECESIAEAVREANRLGKLNRQWTERPGGVAEAGRDPAFNPCADALDLLWRDVILAHKPEYGDWEYPGFAYRHLLAEFNDLRARVAQQADELAAISVTMGLVWHDMGENKILWALPVESATVMGCTTVAEAVAEAKRRIDVDLRQAETRVAQLENECAPYRAALEEAQAPPRPAMMSKAYIASEIAPALRRISEAQRNPLSPELLHARHALFDRLLGLMEEVETATALRLAAGHAERSDSPDSGAHTGKLAGRIWSEVRTALLAVQGAQLRFNDAELDALASEYTDRIAAAISTTAPAGAEHGEARERAIVRLRTVVMYLLGCGMLEGRWFGEDAPAGRGAYWWRTELQQAFSAIAVGR